MHFLFAFLLLAGLFSLTSAFFITIETGFVGVEYLWNNISSNVLQPGLNFYNPITTKIIQIETRPQTDEVKDVGCGTTDGIPLTFPVVTIGNSLPAIYVYDTVSKYGPNYDKYLVTDLVRHQINVICSKKSAHEVAITDFDTLDDLLKEFIQSENDRQKSGLIINFVRLAKPEMPASIAKNYLELAEERILKKVVEEKKERIKSEKESEMIIAQKDNEIRRQNADNQNQIMILNMEAKQKEQFIQNQMIIESAQANAQKIILEADALKSMYNIPGYVDLKKAEAISPNQKIYYGDKLPLNYPLLATNTLANQFESANSESSRIGG